MTGTFITGIILVVALLAWATMAAPTTTARSTPVGYKMPDGWQTLIACSKRPAIQLWEISIKPPGVDGGDPVETTTMHNTVWRTRDRRHLKTLTESTFKAAYDPESWTDILYMINNPDSWTVIYPENSKLAFYGVMTKFEPDELKEGEMPTATVTITPTNWDYVNYVEAAPVFTDSVGT